jgi:glucuronoarabinoxylan endo-1,4-beta-xylanase
VGLVSRVAAPLGLLLLLPVGILLLEHDSRSLQTSTINWNDVRQTIDGFGASSADFLLPLTPAQADFFFTTKGIGLSILRTQIIPDRATCDAEFRKGGCSESNGQILNGELETAKLAAVRGAIVFSTPWSPPGAFKNNGSFKNGGSLLSSHYADWAKDIAGYVTMMADNGVPLYAVSVQNEPNMTVDYGSCRYTAREIHDFVPYLYSALHSAGVGSTKIMIGEQSAWAFDLSSTAMADPKVESEVGILAAHGYAGQIQPLQTGRTRLWQTEASSGSPTYESSMVDGMGWALKIHEYLAVANVNAWLWWFLTNMPSQGEGKDNSALTDFWGNFPKRAYVTGQWSKFIRPGWSRIGVSDYYGPLRITAFKDPEHQSFAIVAVNPGGSDVLQTFVLNGVAPRSVTPWITSEQLSLVPQTPVPVKEGRFVYALPASSVTTFSGTVSQRSGS